MLTVVVKNVKRHHTLHPLAWNLTSRLCGPKGSFNYVGTTLWCQDDVGIKPFAVGILWVSNILHAYCLHFQNAKSPKNRARTEQVRTWEFASSQSFQSVCKGSETNEGLESDKALQESCG